MSAGSRQAPPMPIVITVSGNRSRIRARHPELRRPGSAGSGTTITTSSSRIDVMAPGIRVVKKWSMAAGTRPRRGRGVEGHGQDAVLAGRVIAQVPGPPAHVAVVAPAAEQQPLDQIV